MNTNRLEWKVGIFVLISLGLAGALIVKFSKGTSVFTNTYEILLVTSNVGGIRSGASVLMAGVQVGRVQRIDLDENGKTVTMHVEVHSRYKIHQDALFTIEQAGFLGDQYIAITPGPNLESPVIRPGETVRCQEPFNLQEVARSAAGLLRRVDQTAAKLNEAVERMGQTIFSEQTLSNLSLSVANFRTASERALATLNNVDTIVQTNSIPLSTAMTNLVEFSEELDQVTAELQLAVATNRVEITATVRDLQSGAARVNDLLGDLQAGKGLVGGLLKDEGLRQRFSGTVSNFEVVSSNLAAHGLLWKPPKPRKPEKSEPSIYPGKTP
jgi:phospholipid/cholesterol/gamma-HCH transport system substrate-binding protein